MAKAKTLDVNRSALNALMVTLGFKNCAEWDNAKMGDKIGKLPNIVKSAGKLKLDDDLSNLLDDLLNAPDQGLTVSILDDTTEAVEEATEEQGAEEATEEAAPAKAAPKPVAKPVPAKAAPKPAKAATPAKPKAAPKPPPRKTTLNRPQSAAKVVVAIEAPTSMEDLVAAANQAYISDGGTDNPKESLWAVKMAVQILVAIDLVKQEGNMISLVS